ncbi:MAG: hypothetical protein Q9182_003841 [Xanthomendoza sp. 2 TL-2023]
MSTQAAVIADTIAGLKRATSRYNDSSDSGESIDRFTNRGNKLKRKARYVYEGQLDRPSGSRVYKKRIEHAGYYRDVISQNPHRYDVNGDRLEDDDEDKEADAAAAEDNPYSGVILHELLAPLTSAAQLPTHPSLSVPYLSPILSNMTQEACEMVQRERNTIRGAKQLLTKLRGDDTWIPCGSLDSSTDDMIFDTSKVFEEFVRLRPLPRVADKADESTISEKTRLPLEELLETSPDGGQITQQNTDDDKASAPLLAGMNGHKLARSPDTLDPFLETCNAASVSHGVNSATDDGVNDTTARHDFEVSGSSNSAHPPASEIHERNMRPDYPSDAKEQAVPDRDTALVAETETVPEALAHGGNQIATTEQMLDSDLKASLRSDEPVGGRDGPPTDAKDDDLMADAERPQAGDDDLQPVAHRMTTRAQAQAVSDGTMSSRRRSASAASSSLLPIHPLFLMPSGACPDRDFGLPPDEAGVTRRILMSYIQKQEEVCRGTEKLYNGLLKAERMKKDVLDSCKAEGHVGEMSDGEDWYDKEEWGLDEDLRKGHDEDEDDAGTQHKKTRQRRA